MQPGHVSGLSTVRTISGMLGSRSQSVRMWPNSWPQASEIFAHWTEISVGWFYLAWELKQERQTLKKTGGRLFTSTSPTHRVHFWLSTQSTSTVGTAHPWGHFLTSAGAQCSGLLGHGLNFKTFWKHILKRCCDKA